MASPKNDQQIYLQGENQSQTLSQNKQRENKYHLNDITEINNESINALYSAVQKLWNDLGITDMYQMQFHNSIKNLDEEEINYILINEKKDLNKLYISLKKLRDEIFSRDNNIHSLQRDVIAICENENRIYSINIDEQKRIKNREKVTLEIIGLIKSLRRNSVNVIHYFLKVRELITYYRLIGKIDVRLINSEFKYNDNYLQKMKIDMDFLKQYKLMYKYFDMNNGEIDAFLTNFDSKPSKNINYEKYVKNKARIPITDDKLKEDIIECRYILYKEDIYERMKQGGYDRGNDNMNTDNINVFGNNNMNIMNNRYEKQKIRFFKPFEESQKEFPNMPDINRNNMNKMNRIKGNNSSGKILISKDKNFQERKNLEYLRLNMGKEYNNLFVNDKFHNNKFQYKNYNLSNNNNELNFRRPFIVGNKIKIEREEIKKDRVNFILRDKFLQKHDPLLKENQELNRELNEVCYDNELLNENLQNLENKIREIQKVSLEKENNHQNLVKKMSGNIDELSSQRDDLNKKLRANKTLMEKYNKENEEKINNLNNMMNKQKNEYEEKLSNLNTLMQNTKNELEQNINNLNFQKEELIKEKLELNKQIEQLTKEKNELLINKSSLEENISQLEFQISENKIEIENNIKTINENRQKIEEMSKKINELNNDLINIQNEKQILQNELNQKTEEYSNKINELEKTIQNNQEAILNLENTKNQLLQEKEDLFNSDNNAKMQINNLNDQINSLNIQINDKDEQINNLQSNLVDFNKLKIENEQMNSLINRQKSELEDLKEKLYKLMPNYKYDFYRGNLFNFINDISERLSLENIPDFMKDSFNLEEIKIFEENSYLKGVYPKIIVSTLENTGEITGVCSVYYENYGIVGDPLTLRISVLCVLEPNWEVQIENMINFIKDNIFFDEIKYIIKYVRNPENGKLKLDDKIKSFFKKQLKCSWKNVINYSNGTRTQEIRIMKEGDYFNKDVNLTNNNQFFGLKSVSIVSLYNINESRSIEDNPDYEFKKKYSNIFLKKYINDYPIYLLLANNPKYKLLFNNESEKNIYELPKCREEDDYLYPQTQIKTLAKMNYNLDNISDLKDNIPLFNNNNLLCEEMYEKLQSNLNIFSLNYLTMEINLSTPTNFCLNFENYIYNRISSTKINVLRDPESKNLFYIIPTNNENIFIFLSQIGPKLKEYLLDKNKNLYKALNELHPKLTDQLIQFSSFNISYNTLKNTEKVIYIPSFKIDSHLYSFSVKDIKEKGKVYEIESNKEENLGSIDECFKLSFEGDKNIKDSFSIIPVEDKKLNMVIRESFLFGIFNIQIIEKSPLQLFYVTKDHWISSY